MKLGKKNKPKKKKTVPPLCSFHVNNVVLSLHERFSSQQESLGENALVTLLATCLEHLPQSANTPFICSEIKSELVYFNVIYLEVWQVGRQDTKA